MRGNYKFHAIAIGIICVAITLVYLVMGPKPKPAPVDPNANSDHAIEIYSATWGEECNTYIQDEITRRASLPVEKDDKGMLIPREPLELVKPNNVLEKVSNACNGQLACELDPTPDTMGVNPLPSCAKKLVLSYRCYSYDRLWNLTINQGVNTTINCNATTKKDSGTAPAASAASGK